MTVEANLDVVRRLLDEGWNQGRLEVVDELVAEDAMPAHESPSAGRQSWKDAVVQYRSAFPDLHYSIDDLFGTGDRWCSGGRRRPRTPSASWDGRRPGGRRR